MRVAIIGGSGFIGSVLSKALANKKIAFSILDKNKSSIFPEYWTYCDVTKLDTLESSLREHDVIINLAAEHKDNVSPSDLYYQVNVDGARNVCCAAEKLGINKIIFTSSVAVYGFVDKDTDETGEFHPFNHYGKSKLEAEQVYDQWQAASPTDRVLTTIRPTVVFGEGNRGNVYNLFRQIASGKFLMIGKGNNPKSMAYVENVVAFLTHCLSLSTGRKVFNYVDKPDFDMLSLANLVNDSLGKKTNSIKIPYLLGLSAGYCFDLLANISGKEFPVSSIRVRKFCARTQFSSSSISETGFVAPVSLHDAVIKTVRHEFS
nr:NAD-dependent epimerase/dehydratase family protein [Plesiomonas shigelloides]QLL91077.1 UDP-glucose 4-epimerase [Plesiomonas shigelloides]